MPAMLLPETLASNLTVRFLSLKRFPEVAAAQLSLSRLLCVPLLWLRCPTVLMNVSPVLFILQSECPEPLVLCLARLLCVTLMSLP